MSYHPIFCILPPHMLNKIASNGSELQKQMAVKNLVAASRMRGQRQDARELLALSRNIGTNVKTRTIYDAQQGNSLPGVVVRQEGSQPHQDPAVNEAYEFSGATYDLYGTVFGRNSIDGNGMKLDSTVHYQKGYDNAFWNGQQMVYGDGDEDLPDNQRLFNRFTKSIDVVGHELTHGVTQFEANLTYYQQSGALNESLSDVFGSLVKQYQRQQTASDADWIIGEGLFTLNVKGKGIRSMKAPGTAYDDPVLGKDPQPGHMKDYLNTSSDNGGVHINSGIPNHAFYVCAIEIGGFSWEKAGLIWYLTLKDKLKFDSNFQSCANFTWQVAGEKFGTGSLEQQAVKKGWDAVGIDSTQGGGGGGTPPSDGEGCVPSMLRKLGLIPQSGK
jgi:Zn-dependent metalloprotease